MSLVYCTSSHQSLQAAVGFELSVLLKHPTGEMCDVNRTSSFVSLQRTLTDVPLSSGFHVCLLLRLSDQGVLSDMDAETVQVIGLTTFMELCENTQCAAPSNTRVHNVSGCFYKISVVYFQYSPLTDKIWLLTELSFSHLQNKDKISASSDCCKD